MASSSTASHNQTERKNAFSELASSSSASTSAEPWQIFINHRGPDVKYTLATKIHHKLASMGFRAFLDVEIEPGDEIQAEIQSAMESASLHIAIFSPKYAESPWCLAELYFMIKTGKKIVPIFYHVKPSDLRWVQEGNGEYARAFSQLEGKGRYSKEKLKEWKEALHNISFHSGYEVNNNEDEASVLKEIVNCALKVMKSVPLWVDEHPLGLDELVQGFQSVASEDKVKITGIVGMGGSGKTTLAKELFNRNFSSFQRSSFVPDVRDAASRKALPDMQKKLLQDLGVDHLPFHSVDEGQAILANRLSSLRALIVVDDVDHIDQLYALLPNKDNLGNQSMVIITSRELGALESWGLSCIYKMPALGSWHAEQLFCWHAFKQTSPPADFEILVEGFLKACNGLPLSLKVLGAQLRGKESKDYWKSLLDKISRILPTEIQKRLQISYDALDDEEKEMFLDVACFLIGEWKSTAIALWDGSGWSGLYGVQTLVNKCLVELVYEKSHWGYGDKIRMHDELVYEKSHWGYGDKIRMHDHLRDMGREIASRHSFYRLWRPEQIDNMKQHFEKRMQIRGIRPPVTFVAFKEFSHQIMGNSRRRVKRLGLSCEVQILDVQGNELTEEFKSLSEHLVWLRWSFSDLKILPPWLTLRHLRVLELHQLLELEQLWQDNVDPPPQLRELVIQQGYKLQQLPTSIGHLKYLKKLSVDFIGRSLPEEVCGLLSLEYLHLNSSMLCSLPACFGNLIRLKHINLKWCSKLSILPNSFSQLMGLEDLNLASCAMLSSLPGGFGNLISLKHINLERCSKLSTLPESFKQLVHLEHLNLSGCAKLKLKLDVFENMTKLKMLELSGCKELVDLPNQIANQASLTMLDLKGCIKLKGSPTNIRQLVNLQSLTIESVMLKGLQTSLVRFSSLKDIEIVSSQSKMELDAEEEKWKQVFSVSISNDCCPNLERFEVSGNNKLIPFEVVENRHLMEIETLPVSLKMLSISHCEVLKNISCLSELVCLETLILHRCPQLEELSSFADLALLKEFCMRFCPKVEKIGGLQHSKPFKELRLSGLVCLEKLTIACCPRLEELPSFAASVSLEHFQIGDCPKVEKIEGLQHSNSLKYFEMMKCTKVEKIGDLQHCESLKELRLLKTGWKVPGIQSLEKVEGLETLVLECDTISALKPCILSMKGCPREMRIQGSVSRFVEPVVDSLKFPDLAVKEVKFSDEDFFEV